ncbi:MAG TPA: hypothetical protein VN428_20110 [Bryobacteraceae bacterium]|nr:hypothetical protein [Bryobacteraceae bacterium]
MQIIARVSAGLRITGIGIALTVCAAGQTLVDLRTQGKNVDFSGAASTRPFRTGTVIPSSCNVGEAFFKTDAQPGRNLFACTGTDVWTLESGGMPEAPGEAGRVLASDGVASSWTAIGGDAAGTPAALRVERVQGRRVSDSEPADGQVLRWNAAAAQWEPQAAAGGSNVSYAFTSQTAVSIPSALHGFGTANLLVACYDNASPNARMEPASVTVHPGTFDVAVQFAAPQSGRCVVNGAGSGAGQLPLQSNTFSGGSTQTFLGSLVASSAERTAPVKTGTVLPATCVQGDQFFRTDAPAGQNLYFCTSTNVWTQMRAGGDVASVFGRSGTVAAQAGDYSFSQIAGSVTDAQVAPGLDAAKIGAGSVTNSEFGYLANVTADIQGQLGGKADAVHAHSLAGDLGGNTGSATVQRLQGRPVAASAPADGQALVWNAGASAWQPGAVTAAAAGMASHLGDFRTERSGASTLTVGRDCTPGSPCNARFGNVVYSFTSSCTASISGGTGMAFIYIASGGTVTIGHNLTVSASGNCVAQPNVTSFPADSVPLSIWQAVNGAWEEAGGRDVRAWLGTKAMTAGSGIMTLESAGRTTVSVDPAVVPAYATASATLNFGSIQAGGCSADLTFPLPGAVIGDSVAPGWPGALEAGLTGTMRVSASNTVAVRLCNLSGGAIDPVSAAFRATVVTSF